MCKMRPFRLRRLQRKFFGCRLSVWLQNRQPAQTGTVRRLQLWRARGYLFFSYKKGARSLRMRRRRSPRLFYLSGLPLIWSVGWSFFVSAIPSTHTSTKNFVFKKRAGSSPPYYYHFLLLLVICQWPDQIESSRRINVTFEKKWLFKMIGIR